VLEVLLPALKMPGEVQELLLGCLKYTPEQRWSLETLCESPVLREGYTGLVGWQRPHVVEGVKTMVAQVLFLNHKQQQKLPTRL
jgi:hypothetical protein